MSANPTLVLAVSTGVVVIVVVVAVALVLVVLMITLSMRGRQVRAANQRDAVRRDLDEARARTEPDSGVPEERVEGTDPDR